MYRYAMPIVKAWIGPLHRGVIVACRKDIGEREHDHIAIRDLDTSLLTVRLDNALDFLGVLSELNTG